MMMQRKAQRVLNYHWRQHRCYFIRAECRSGYDAARHVPPLSIRAITSSSSNEASSAKISMCRSEEGGGALYFLLPSTTPSSGRAKLILSPPFTTSSSWSTSILSNKDDNTSQQQQIMAEAVERHYGLEQAGTQQFVGGMGENDGGVWFLLDGTGGDTLDHWQLIRDTVQLVKEQRHGIPFGVFTSGQVLDRSNHVPPLRDVLNSELGLTNCQVTLGGSNPMQYRELMQTRLRGRPRTEEDVTDTEASKAFGDTCGFIAGAVEAGFPITVSVAKKFASSASELARALGAVEVQIFDTDERQR